jgi:group I intron endonuclease
MRAHFRDAQRGCETPFACALRKYGADGFVFEILEKCSSLEELNAAEAHWILSSNSLGPQGYNCTTGGEGFRRTEESNRKISRARKGRPLPEHHREAISRATRGKNNPFWGRKHEKESVERMKIVLSAKFSGAGNPFYGKKHATKVVEAARLRGKKRGFLPKWREAAARTNLGNGYTKGRVIPTREKEKRSSLRLVDVEYIVANPEGLTKTALSDRFSVTWWAIHNAATGRTWKEVDRTDSYWNRL